MPLNIEQHFSCLLHTVTKQYSADSSSCTITSNDKTSSEIQMQLKMNNIAKAKMHKCISTGYILRCTKSSCLFSTAFQFHVILLITSSNITAQENWQKQSILTSAQEPPQAEIIGFFFKAYFVTPCIPFFPLPVYSCF